MNCSGINSKNRKFFDTKNCQVNSGNFFTFSQYAIVSENKVLKLNRKTNPKIASLLGCAIPTSLGSVDWLRIKKKSKVLVVGLGGIGITILKYLSSSKDLKIFAYDIDNKKNQFVIKNFKNITIFKKESSENKKFDYAIEAAGSVLAMENCVNIIKNTGTVLIIGNDNFNSALKINTFEFDQIDFNKYEKSIFSNLIQSFNACEFIKGKKIFGSWGGFIKKYDKKFRLYEKFVNKNERFFLKLLSKPNKINNAQKVFKHFGKKQIRPIFKF